MKRDVRIAALVLALVFGSTAAQAQTAAVSGRVVDPQGGVVVNAQVSIDMAPAPALSTRSAPDGSFTVPQVPVGTRTLRVDAPGFVAWSRQVAVAADGARVDVMLQVAGVAEQVEVVGVGRATLATTPTVTASRLGLTGLETPASIHILPGELIRERGDLTVAEARSRAPGVVMQATPGNGGAGVIARGFSGVNAIMQLYDGGQQFVGSGTLSYPFDPWTVERIEVLGGPASVLYGTGALGGVINVVPRKPNVALFENSVRMAAGSHNTWRGAVDSTGPVSDRVAYRLNLSHNRSAGWMERGDSDSTALSASVRFAVTPAVNITVSEDYGHQNPETYFGVPFVDGQFDEALRNRNFNVADADITYRDSWTQVRTEWQRSPRFRLRNNVQILDTRRDWRNVEEYEHVPAANAIDRFFFIEIEHYQRQYGTRTEAVATSDVLGRSNTLAVGFDVNWASFEHVNNAPYSGTSRVGLDATDPGSFINVAGTLPKFRTHTNQVAAFVEDRLALTSRLSLVGGVRLDRYETERTDLLAGTTSTGTFTPASWRGGAVYTVRPDLTVYGQYSTATEFIGSLISMSIAQHTLEPTTGRQIEVGVKQSLLDGRADWTVAGYHIVKERLLMPDPDNPTVSIQVGQQSARGVEATAALGLAAGVRVHGNLAVLGARFDDFLQVVGGVPVQRAGNVPPGIPQRAANLWVTWDPTPAWQARTGIRFVGERHADIANTVTIPGYTVVDAGIRRSLTERLAVDLRLYNAFDRIYPQATYGSPFQWILGRPRTAEVSLAARF